MISASVSLSVMVTLANVGGGGVVARVQRGDPLRGSMCDSGFVCLVAVVVDDFVIVGGV